MIQQTIYTCLFAEIFDVLDGKYSRFNGAILEEYFAIVWCSAGEDVERCSTCDLWIEKDPVYYEDLIERQPSFELIPEQDLKELNFT